MAENEVNKKGNVDIEMMVAEVETGARSAAGFAGKFIIGLAFVWSLFSYLSLPTFPTC